MADIEGLLGHRNFAFMEFGVGLVTLLHYHKCAPHVVVQRMDPEIGSNH